MPVQKKRIINSFLNFIIISIRPLLGPINCKFALGCTSYATMQLQEKSLFYAIMAICKRLIACCSPF